MTKEQAERCKLMRAEVGAGAKVARKQRVEEGRPAILRLCTDCRCSRVLPSKCKKCNGLGQVIA